MSPIKGYEYFSLSLSFYVSVIVFLPLPARVPDFLPVCSIISVTPFFSVCLSTYLFLTVSVSVSASLYLCVSLHLSMAIFLSSGCLSAELSFCLLHCLSDSLSCLLSLPLFLAHLSIFFSFSFQDLRTSTRDVYC